MRGSAVFHTQSLPGSDPRNAKFQKVNTMDPSRMCQMVGLEWQNCLPLKLEAGGRSLWEWDSPPLSFPDIL
jgi:hypothetical protein